MDNRDLIIGLQNAYKEAKIIDGGSAYVNMLEREYIKALEGKFDLEKIYKTKDGRYKTYVPIQICRKNKIDVLKGLYAYYYGADDLTLEVVYKKWISDFEELAQEGHRSFDTSDHYKSDWKKFLEGTALSKTPICEIKVSTLKSFYRAITAHAAITRKTLNNVKSLMNHIFDYALDLDYVSDNVARKVNTKDLICKETVSNEAVYSDDECNAIIKAALEKSNTYARAIVLMFCLCVRVGEVEALKWEHINFEDRTIYIGSSMRRTRDENGKQIYVWTDSLKGRQKESQRMLHMSDLAYTVLKEQRRNDPFSEFVFMENGHALLTTQFNRWLKRFCESAGVTYYSSHKIRFTNITKIVNCGGSLAQAQKAAGHKHITTTDHYIRNSKINQIEESKWNEIFGYNNVNVM
ncbi:MAG: site-specific integrase [Lachnospiraceae bacterium]|nr:site-specific integrase [Lachnospiraceae bacterium]